jgi:preprotein translocase subunit SecA
MRLFGSDRISGIMERLGIQEGEVLEHRWLNRSIETAQRRVEQQNFSIRKRTLEYDDVMNKQREIIYGFRSQIVAADQVRDKRGGVDAEATAKAVVGAGPQGLCRQVRARGSGPAQRMERFIMLNAVDTQWQEYLRNMDTLRQGVGLRAYGQRDPLVEYKNEAYTLFADLMDRIKGEIAGRIFRATTSPRAYQTFLGDLHRLAQAQHPTAAPLAGGHAAGSAAGRRGGGGEGGDDPGAEAAMNAALSAAHAKPVVRDAPKTGRNDPCPCGSGKKYKKCCGHDA